MNTTDILLVLRHNAESILKRRDEFIRSEAPIEELYEVLMRQFTDAADFAFLFQRFDELLSRHEPLPTQWQQDRKP